MAEPTFERVTLDTDVLLGARNREFLAAADLGLLSDEDDRPIVQTAIAADVPGTLVTDNRRDFPLTG